MPNAPRRNRVAALREERDRWRDRAVAAEARVAAVVAAIDEHTLMWPLAAHDGAYAGGVVLRAELEKALR